MRNNEHLKSLIRHKSKTLGISSNIILRYVIFELFLEKLALSKYANHFIIKGGFLVSAKTKINLRTTMDLDVTLKSLSFNKNGLENYITEILNIFTHENLIMTLVNIEEIHENAEYTGLRATIFVRYEALNETIKIDFTTGDPMTPNESNFDYITLLEKRVIKLKSYNIETVLAEKMETILSRGIFNTRMRDYYDTYILFNLRNNELNHKYLSKAFNNTANYRQTLDSILKNNNHVLDSIEQDAHLIELWTSYQESYSFAHDITWNQIITTIKMINDIIFHT